MTRFGVEKEFTMRLDTPSSRAKEHLIAKVPHHRWVHSIDLGGGLVTPGQWGPPNPCIVQAMDSVDFRGKKVLDIGSWDGLWAFEAERRGAAEVVAIDLVTQRKFSEDSSFGLAHAILESKVKYDPSCSVYDVEKLRIDDFDVVIYPGVYYHLKDPLLSFARLRRVMKEGATLIVEGAVIDSIETYARFYYREPYLTDYSNWWVPTVGCLRQWVECNYFAPEADVGFWDAGGDNLRFTLTATAVRRADPHYIRPPEGLAEFDMNTYPRTFSDPVAQGSPDSTTPGRRLIQHPAQTSPLARLRGWAGSLARRSGLR
jgi:tRNA (mo5U34)-methyltransferase